MSEIRFDDRVAVITGAGGGLGKTYAVELARRGAKIVVNDLGGAADGTGGGSSMADATVREIEEAGGTALANYDSVATPEGGAAIIQTALDAFGQVDVVINNAGILRDKSFVKLEPKDLKAVLAVHLEGAFYVSQPAFRAMKERSYGRFLFTASTAGIFGNFGQTNYGAAKFGLVGLSNVLAIEGAKYNINSNAIAPVAKTRMTENLLGPLARIPSIRSRSPRWPATWSRRSATSLMRSSPWAAASSRASSSGSPPAGWPARAPGRVSKKSGTTWTRSASSRATPSRPASATSWAAS
jgi:NAD(P)-dependent dehydrogenase (short-subunit alcohol dehydrogenase family)